jgi:parallel beta-helix repeat protein
MLAICCLAASSSAASATTRWVNDDDPNGGLYAPPGTSCNNPGYSTIQLAVNASASGDRINVCPGTYTEEVTIPAGKNNILLRSVQSWAAVIKAPAVMLGPTKSIVRVSGAWGVTILAFTITGPGGTGCDSLRYGVRVDTGGSADILGNHITHIHDTPFSGCQNGVAVLVGRQADATIGSARILGNVIDTYQKNGPTVSNGGSYAEIAFNRILGVGPTAVIAQNGVQASSDATASIRHNFVAGHIYTPQTFASTGILLFDSGQVNIVENTVTSNDVGVYLFDLAAGSTSAHNRVRASTFDGIVLDIANSNRVAYNKTDQNNGPGIGVYGASQDNALEANLVKSNGDSGILLDDGDSNDIEKNHITKNGTSSGDTTDGIRVSMLSTSNTLQDNHLNRNVTHDCHDDSLGGGTAATANFWIDNKGQTSKPLGLCPEADDEDAERFEMSTTFGWDPNYAWYLDGSYPVEAAEYDWSAAYATVDTATLLQLIPQVRLGVVRATMNPYE